MNELGQVCTCIVTCGKLFWIVWLEIKWISV
jgi:hypothetical protein